jgi:AbiV family abortive infection protein
LADVGRPALVRFAAKAAQNASDLAEDAELLVSAGRYGRAYSLAALAVEEVGKAGGLLALAMMPDDMRARAPVRELLEWHQLKQMGGLLAGVLEMSTPGVTSRLAATSTGQLAELLSGVAAQARDTDQAKKRGFYVDMDDARQIREPSEVSEAEAREAVARARHAATAASMLSDPSVQARLADPPPDALPLASMVFGAYFQNRDIDSAEAVAALVGQVARSLTQAEEARDSADPS